MEVLPRVKSVSFLQAPKKPRDDRSSLVPGPNSHWSCAEVILGSMRPLRMSLWLGLLGEKGISAPGVCQSTDF